ncbi:ATP-binding protein [Nocardioides solisilvae]|uniref:ATP-binding protein n=1 Tax=Nocardioides solisilvae TaxID=1542435 RepID=UPI001EF4B2EE|nr:ATP-binding protein [Nocardioides solisilvae]
MDVGHNEYVGHNGRVRARVLVLAGPSGAGKSRLAERLGLPVLRLDDFYRDASEPDLPRITEGANAGLVDWDHPGSWHHDAALAALHELCTEGSADVPVYSIPHSAVEGHRPLDLGEHRFFVAEGIFAADVVPACAEAGLLAGAYCVRQHRVLTFWRRLVRDLRERRKPPLVLVRRGLSLMRAQRRVVAHAVALGCRPVTGDEAHREIRALMAAPEPAGR